MYPWGGGIADIETVKADVILNEISPAPDESAGDDAVLYNGEAYIVGLSSIYKYNFETDKYTTLYDLGYSNTDPGVVLVGDNIYMVGGSHDAYNISVYNITKNTLTNIETPDTVGTLKDQPSMYLDGKIYNYNGLNDMDIYGVATNTWTRGTGSGVYNNVDPSAVVIGTDIYYIGGNTQKTMLVYHTLTDSWTRKNDLPIVLRDHIAQYNEKNNMIYVFDYDLTYIYDVENDKWMEGDTTGLYLFRSSSIIYDNMMYMFTLCFTTEEDTKRSFTFELPLPVYSTTLLTNVDDATYSIVGQDTRGGSVNKSGTFSQSEVFALPEGVYTCIVDKDLYYEASTMMVVKSKDGVYNVPLTRITTSKSVLDFDDDNYNGLLDNETVSDSNISVDSPD